MKAIGCWNCQWAIIDGHRPSRWQLNTEYRAGCDCPDRTGAGAIANISMTEERPDLSVCKLHVLVDKEGG